MSRTTTRTPEFRLLFGYPTITLTRSDRPGPVATVAAGSPEFPAEFRDLAAEVTQGGGRLTVVLPESEVWRGALDPAPRSRAARRHAARALAAADLGAPPSDLAVVVAGNAAAATRRSTLSDVRALVGKVGLRSDAIVGEGAFAGFPAPPGLDAKPAARPALLAAGALAAVAAAAALHLAQPGPVPSVVAELPPAPAIEFAMADPVAPKPTPKPAPVPAVPLALAHAERPASRPKPVPAIAPPGVTQGTRSVDFLWVKPERGGVPELRLAELTTARARMTDATMLAPLPRPAAAALLAPASAATSEDPDALRPMHRPSAAAPAVAAAPQKLPAPDGFARPRPRPDERSVKVVSLAPEAAAIAGLAAASVASAPPPDRPDDLRPPAPKRQAEKPAPKVTVVKSAPAAIPAIQVAPAAVPRLPAATPQRVITAAPQRVVTAAPQRVVAVAPQRVASAAPVPVTARPPVNAAPPQAAAFSGAVRSGITRGNVSLIGVFGDSDGRHALLRLPNGQIERVRAGDSLQGIQVAAVGKDSVQITGRGRSTLLRLPD